MRHTHYVCGCRCGLPPDDTPCPAGMHEASPVGPTMGQGTMRHVHSVSPELSRVPSDPLGQAPSWPSGSPLQVVAGGRMRPQHHNRGPEGPGRDDRCRRLRGIPNIHLSKIGIFEKRRFGCAPGCMLPMEPVDVDMWMFVRAARNPLPPVQENRPRQATFEAACERQERPASEPMNSMPCRQTATRPRTMPAVALLRPDRDASCKNRCSDR